MVKVGPQWVKGKEAWPLCVQGKEVWHLFQLVLLKASEGSREVIVASVTRVLEKGVWPMWQCSIEVGVAYVSEY